MRRKEFTSEAVGAKIRKARLRAGITQAALGEKIGLTDQAVATYEKGSRTVTVPMLGKIARALKVRPEELLP